MSKLQRRLKKNEKPIPKVEAEFATENVINPTQYELLRAIEKAGGFVSPDGLRVAFGATSVQTDFNIQDLEEKGYIHKDYVSKHNGVMYQFTQPGRRALLEETQRRTFLSEQEKAALEWEGKVGANIKNSG
jgi:DNA-binding PadR family transcriptional regulator